MPAYATPFLLVAAIFTALSFFPVSLFDVVAQNPDSQTQTAASVESEKSALFQEESDQRPVVQHVPLPNQVKTIYMTACVAGTKDFRNRLIALIEDTEINSVIIDIKDFSGGISFPSTQAAWKAAWDHAPCGAPDMRQLVAELHEKGIYVIARITVFQDPLYARSHPEQAVLRSDATTIWADHKGLAFVDVAAKPYWDHVINLSAEVYNLGFDELNFDYVRYPSDGNMTDIYFPQSMAGQYGADKQANLEAFFQYLNEKLDEESRFAEYRHENTGRASSTPYTSADLFGMTTTNYNDLTIGQVQERAAPYFDFIAPMVYPSHYPYDAFGLGNPNDHPYEIVHYAMKSGVNRMKATVTPLQGFLHKRVGTTTPAVYEKPSYGPEKLRTWIQDFDYGGDYDAADVRAQIQASYDAGVMSWMMWAPSNIYTRAALHGPE